MKILTLATLFSFLTISSLAQDNAILALKNLAGSTWISEGEQLGGHQGKTVKEMSWGLDGKIVKVKTYTTDPKTLEFGLRNEGVRIFNTTTGQLEFYEFDKFGGVSQGVIIVDGKNLHYEYQYGDLLLRDSWYYRNDNEYLYIVASWQDGKQTQKYHEGVFVRQ